MDEDNTDPAQEMLNEGGTGTPAPAVNYQQMFEAMQQQNAQLAQQNANLAQTVQQVAARPVMQQQIANTPDPFDVFDDKAKTALKAVIEQQNASFKQQFQQQEQRFSNMQLEAEANSIAAMPGLDPEITKYAQAVFKGNRAKGIPLTASEAVDFAIGQAIRNGTFKGTVPSAHQTRGAPPTVLPGGGRPPVPPKARPTNFDGMSRKQQIAHLESDESIHNAPIQGFWETDND